eukprot:gene4449-6292_t
MDDDYEIDASIMFKQEADGLTSIQNLEEGLNLFGYSIDDKISRRDLAIIFNLIRKEMESEIFILANNGSYERAKEMRAILTKIREEFDNIQLSQVKNATQSEIESFKKAEIELNNNLRKMHSKNIDEFNDFYNKYKDKHDYFQEIENENLEKRISKIRKPSMKYSKRLIELFKAEYGLNKLKEYEEAIKVRKMIDKIRPKEEKKFNQNFENSIENIRKKLVQTHVEDNARTNQKLTALQWREIRMRELEASVNNQRIKNHTKDMLHTHSMKEKLKPETSVKPSALWQTRAGYEATSSFLRGSQLLDHARGKKEGVHVFADSLVERHNFNEVPQDTFTLYNSYQTFNNSQFLPPLSPTMGNTVKK